MKLCKDCKHYVCSWRTLWQPKCARNHHDYTDPVTGETKRIIEYKDCMRERDGFKELSFWHYAPPGWFCGTNAEYWEPKQ